jgi:hypothetical protein
MATTTSHATYGTIISGLTTELNSVANNANTAAGPAIDNSALGEFLWGDVELVLAAQGTARTAGAAVYVWFLASADGSNYPDVIETSQPDVVFALDAATTARRHVQKDVPLPPGLFKVFARNGTGQALAASASTVKIRPHNLSSV